MKIKCHKDFKAFSQLPSKKFTPPLKPWLKLEQNILLCIITPLFLQVPPLSDIS